MREHDRLGAAVTTAREQFEGAAARAGGMRLRAGRRGLSTEDIVRAYGTAMCESSAGRIATGRVGTAELTSTAWTGERLAISRAATAAPGAWPSVRRPGGEGSRIAQAAETRSIRLPCRSARVSVSRTVQPRPLPQPHRRRREETGAHKHPLS